MCILCDTRLYKKGLKIFNESDYEIDMERLIFQVNKKISFDIDAIKDQKREVKTVNADIFRKQNS